MGDAKQAQHSFKRVTVPVVGQTGTEGSQRRPSDVNRKGKVKACEILEHSNNSRSFRLPKGLVGTKSTAQVIIKGEEVNCLIDTGSQVTTVPQSFYARHFSEQDIKPLHDLLEVEGANGQFVPYLGYIEMTVTFPKVFVGAPIDVHTLALVVPDLRDTTQPLVLIGTNALDILYNIYSETSMTEVQPIPQGYRAVLKFLELRKKQLSANYCGTVKL